MKKTLRCAAAAMSAIAIVTASSVPVSAAGYFKVFGSSNSCNSNSNSNNCNVSVNRYCPDYSDISSFLKSCGLQGLFGNYGSCTGNSDNSANCPWTNSPGTGTGAESGSNDNSCDNGSCDTVPGTWDGNSFCWNGNCITIPGIGTFNPGSSTSKPDTSTPDTTPSKPDTSRPDTSTSTPSTDDSSVSDYEKKVVELVNVERAKYGLSALTLNTELSAVARAKSQDMKDKQYFSHTSPTYGSPFDMMKSFGISYKTAGENIAMGYRTPEAVVEGWMNSEGHRANILNSSFKEIGVGHVVSGNYWTQMFIG